MEEELANELASNTNDLLWVNMLNSTIKESLYRTLLGCINYYYPQVISFYSSETREFTKQHAQDLVVFKVEGDKVMKDLGLDEHESMLNCSFTIYAPEIFAGILN